MTEQNSRPFARELIKSELVMGVSTRTLAKKVGVNHSTLSRIRNEIRTPTLENAVRIARALYPDNPKKRLRLYESVIGYPIDTNSMDDEQESVSRPTDVITITVKILNGYPPIQIRRIG